jgi:hypothetical protein
MSTLTSLINAAIPAAGGSTPKVFFNGALTSTDLTGLDTWTLFTNDAKTTAVIEAVQVDGTIGPFNADGATVAGNFINDSVVIGATSNLEGSEITAPSTTLTVKLSVPLELTDFNYYEQGGKDTIINSTTSIYYATKSDLTITSPSYYAINQTEEQLIVKYFDALYDGVKTETSGEQTVPTMNEPRWYYATDNDAYYFYSTGDSLTQLYHASVGAGVVGSWSAISTTTYAYMALDIEKKKVFYTHSSNIYEWDLVTDTGTTLKTGGVTATSTNTTAGAANGVFFYGVSTSNETNLYYYDTNTSEYGVVPVPTQFQLGTDPHCGVCYNPDENKFYVSIGYNTASYIYAIDWTTKVAVYLGPSSVVYPNNLTSMYAMLGNDQGEMFIHSNTANLQIIKFANNVATVQEEIASINGQANPNSNSAWYREFVVTAPQTVTLAVEDYDVNFKCKVSGTEYRSV